VGIRDQVGLVRWALTMDCTVRVSRRAALLRATLRRCFFPEVTSYWWRECPKSECGERRET